MKVLMVDVGGTNVKMMAAGHEGYRKFPSGEKLTAAQMAKGVLKATEDWEYEVVSLGFPGLVVDGQPSRNPLNLGGGWVGFDFRKALKRPVHIINDAAMQALAHYEGGRMLFIGLGTSVGAALIADDTIIPIEVGMLRLTKTQGFMDRISKPALARLGRKRWEKSVFRVVELLQDCFWPQDIYLGGGNAKLLSALPQGCRRGDNQDAFRGALRLWPGSDMLAEPYATTWRIKRRRSRKKSR